MKGLWGFLTSQDFLVGALLYTLAGLLVEETAQAYLITHYEDDEGIPYLPPFLPDLWWVVFWPFTLWSLLVTISEDGQD